MTICISVACDVLFDSTAKPKLIMVSDTMLSLGPTSSITLKARYLADTWSALMAGEDVTYADDVLARCKSLLRQRDIAHLVMWLSVSPKRTKT